MRRREDGHDAEREAQPGDRPRMVEVAVAAMEVSLSNWA
jgi:hypothetical protein